MRTRCVASPMWPSASRSAQLLGRETLAVVVDGELELPVGLDEAKCQLGRLRVPSDVRQQLARRREDQLLLRMAGRVCRIEPQLQVRATCCLSADRAQRRLEPALLEHVRVQVEDRLAQLSNGLGERVVGAVQSGVRERLARLLEFVARRQQVLDRVIVQRLGERLALALLGRERVREQARPLLGEPGNERSSSGEQHREQHAARPRPRPGTRPA